MLVRLLYSLLWHLALPLVGVRLLWRARRQPEYLLHLGERFGGVPRFTPQMPCIWIHAVSVGETRAAQPLIKGLLEQYPEHRIVLSHMTPTGRATGQELFAKETRVASCFLPYDLPWAMRRFLRRLHPQIGIVMETEVWPNLMCAAKAQGLPVLLANARLSERSARGYTRLGELARTAYGSFAAVLAQTPADAERLKACGARLPVVTGNVKFDVALSPEKLSLGESFRAAAGGRPVILAASTREGEEAPLLEAFKRHASADALLVLVPRHPQRFDEVAGLVRDCGLSAVRRSESLSIAADTRVWLGDSMGEMIAYYRMADVAIIGGSWLPLGGQNLIEACAVGVPVLIGQYTFNFAEAAEKAIAAGAALRCKDLDAALCTAAGLLADKARIADMAKAGREFAAANKGATQITLARLAEQLAKAQPAP